MEQQYQETNPRSNTQSDRCTEVVVPEAVSGVVFVERSTVSEDASNIHRKRWTQAATPGFRPFRGISWDFVGSHYFEWDSESVAGIRRSIPVTFCFPGPLFLATSDSRWIRSSRPRLHVASTSATNLPPLGTATSPSLDFFCRCRCYHSSSSQAVGV